MIPKILKFLNLYLNHFLLYYRLNLLILMNLKYLILHFVLNHQHYLLSLLFHLHPKILLNLKYLINLKHPQLHLNLPNH